MTGVDPTAEVVKETTVFLSFMRICRTIARRGRRPAPLDEALPLMLAASLAGAEAVADMARFGQAKLSLP